MSFLRMHKNNCRIVFYIENYRSIANFKYILKIISKLLGFYVSSRRSWSENDYNFFHILHRETKNNKNITKNTAGLHSAVENTYSCKISVLKS